jgi:hypothetical protein
MKTTIYIMTGHSNQEKIEKRSSQGQHRIARTGYPGQDTQDRITGQHVWTGCSAKSVREIIIGSQKLENDNWDCILHCMFG